MKIQASTILSFVTGRLYSTTAPTVLFAELTKTIAGLDYYPMTHQMPAMKDRYSAAILAQLPNELARTCQTWEHTDNWRERIELIDDAFGEIEIHPA